MRLEYSHLKHEMYRKALQHAGGGETIYIVHEVDIYDYQRWVLYNDPLDLIIGDTSGKLFSHDHEHTVKPFEIHYYSTRWIGIINAAYRKFDSSNLFPILGRFNATELAIRRARKKEYSTCAEYIEVLENELSQIVNDPKNLPGMSMSYRRWQ